jgi:hypothetical protein
MVTHYEVSDADVKKAITGLERIMKGYALPPSTPALMSDSPPAAETAAAAGAGSTSTAVQMTPVAESASATGRPMGRNVLSDRLVAPRPSSANLSDIIETSATTISTQTMSSSRPDEANVGMVGGGGEVEELSVHGVSSSEEGFVVLLAQKGKGKPQRLLKILITPSDPMSAGLDVQQVRPIGLVWVNRYTQPHRLADQGNGMAVLL